ASLRLGCSGGPSPVNPLASIFFAAGGTLMARAYHHFFQQQSSTTTRVLLILGLAFFAHIMVKIVTLISERTITLTQQHRNRFNFVAQQPKFVTIVRLVANTVTWCIYFVAIGLFLEECGVNLTAYLASASVIGLAISFGSQGLVQDMVIGLTLIFSDAMDVNDMVEIVGSAVVVGRVQEIGLRFTKVLNLYDQVVFIPNRTVANVSRFPHGGIYAYADIQLPPGADREKTAGEVRAVAYGLWREFGALILSEPGVDQIRAAQDGGWEFLRVRFTIWPGQGSLIETAFRQQILKLMKTHDPNYAEWQIAVLYRALAM
ncbi:MAG TPA: mechanosensitive ion channel domain-containing protein, partial [Opitutaceae bacterium]|nr:mechanosensitive ion channel domain-containing protein [Opitutaceae bacterium]